MSIESQEIPADIKKIAEGLFDPYVGLYDGPSEYDVAVLILAERQRCARIASDFSMKPDRSVHPDIPWDQMPDAIKTTAHTTAQQIAALIVGDTDDD
ncbi:MAG: hypothetical protein E5V64_06490 [Mesorhizobium sp.]|uniref:hypothetical protein n=1 Tax=Mesorhizobium sp. TaxID=1871066 RepID=UPI001218B186|nr:hypothetical protein [Mesorhizobium sp.]TIV83808.1 MAG: hypothetical protein E5V64_06490 [Mesorhizobium sp.]